MEEEKSSTGGLSYLTKGANVEALSSEGAWFPATVLDPPAAHPPTSKTRRNSKSFTSNKVLIQYNTLVSDKDPTKPLVEHTTVSLLRPAPPAETAEEERFELNDGVDGFSLGGWWPGVVISVVGEKYTVRFKNPPDLLELRRSGLRSHWVWDRGVWTKAPKEVMRGSNYKPGTAVEVNLNKNHQWFSWLPAIYLGQLGDESFLVQYRYKTLENVNADGLVKVVVADHQIRPRPPRQEDNKFHLLQMVDAFDDMGWWVGDVTKVLPMKRYIVAFRGTKEEKEFCHSDVRCHVEWINKQWVTSSSESHSPKDHGGQPRHARKGSSNSVGKTPCHTKFRTKQLSPCMDKLPCGKTTDKLKVSQHPNDDSTFISPTPCKKLKGEGSENTPSLAQYCRRKTSATASKRKGLFTDEELNQQQWVRQVDSLAITVVKRSSQPNSQFAKHGKKIIPRKLHVSNGGKIVRGDQEHVMTMIESFGIPSEPKAIRGSQAGNSCLLPLREIGHENIHGVSSGIVGKEKQAELCVLQSKKPAAGWRNDILEKPASSSWITYQRKKRFEPTGVKHNGTGVVTDFEVSKTNVVEQTGNSTGTVNGHEDGPKLPFVKSLPLWENIESMEVFKNLPQKPHFLPLLKEKDIFREGLAIGSMSTFASFVEKISHLRVNDPRKSIERFMEGLVEMESMGFDVKALRDRLTDLLDMKVKFEQLQRQSEEVKIKITRSTHEKMTYDEKIIVVDKKIKDLRKERKMAASKKEVKDSEISRLEAEAAAINEQIQSSRYNFGKLVAAEW